MNPRLIFHSDNVVLNLEDFRLVEISRPPATADWQLIILYHDQSKTVLHFTTEELCLKAFGQIVHQLQQLPR